MRIAITILLFLSVATTALAGNSEIDYLVRSCGVRLNKPNVDTMIVDSVSHHGNVVRYRLFYLNGKCVHAGVAIFEPTVLFNKDNSLVYQFIERKFLVWIFQKNLENLTYEIRRCSGSLLVNGVPFSYPSFQPSSISLVLSKLTGFSITQDSTSCIFQGWSGEKQLILRFRQNYFDITSQDKISADSLLFRTIAELPQTHCKPVIDSFSKLIQDSIFVCNTGKAYAEIFHSDFFCLKKNGHLSPLYSTQFPLMSFISCLIEPGEKTESFPVLLTHMQYGGAKKCKVPIGSLIGLFKNHELFFATDDSTSISSGVLLAVNRKLNYIHVMCFSTKKDVFFGETPLLACRLYSYVPTDNVANLYTSYKKGPKPKFESK